MYVMSVFIFYDSIYVVRKLLLQKIWVIRGLIWYLWEKFPCFIFHSIFDIYIGVPLIQITPLKAY